jgi:AcrR family transcriptional regulator
MSAIRAATRAELADYGYAGVTFEGVARRAQTSKPVLYRRYHQCRETN